MIIIVISVDVVVVVLVTVIIIVVNVSSFSRWMCVCVCVRIEGHRSETAKRKNMIFFAQVFQANQARQHATSATMANRLKVETEREAERQQAGQRELCPPTGA